ncbi:hypothetical protein RclHR1_05510008 [Rhizophagus clarus]|uniref:CCHC-type domain-containing protein n=1 Tax=Rhizophagus clarus TaxID=94130 RepID=A0A2Z6SF89_9GLOM|nr:hypothetical protein RclHR1_05510008 [Rhizophagus clarus]GES80857.1 hypothetical protein GLOIN_2v1780320 [Rhizophagus clarus]
MNDNNWEIVKSKKASHNKRLNQKPNERNCKPLNQKPNERNYKLLKKTKYGTGCLYCHKEGHWQWECPEIRCKNCGKLGHKICEEKFQPANKPQRVVINQEVNVYSQGPVYRKDKQQGRFPPPKEMKICQECGRNETAWISIKDKHYIIIIDEELSPENENIEQKYGPLCLKCEEKFKRRIFKAKGEYKPIECNQCGEKGSRDIMEQLQEEGYEPKYYCDLNCLYARKILMEEKIDKERLEILLNRYTEGSKYKGSQCKDVTKKEIIKRMKGSEMYKELTEHHKAKEQQQKFYESWKKAIKANEFGNDFPTYFKEVILQDPEIKELIGLRPEGTLALERSIEFKNKQLKEYNYLQAKYGNLTEFIEMQIKNKQQQQIRIQQLENELATLKVERK